VKNKNEGRESLVERSRPISKNDIFNSSNLTQPKLSTQYFLDSIERLCARALALTFHGLDATAEIELARRLAIFAERRVA
jgi:hypothetical protein